MNSNLENLKGHNPYLEFLTFRLGGQSYGIDIMKVQEIRAFEKTTRITKSEDFILGVVDLRGMIVPILDMRIKFGFNTADYDNETVTIVTMIGDQPMGLVVDAVSDVVRFTEEQIKATPDLGTFLPSDNIIGLADAGEGMTILLNLESLLNGKEISDIESCI